MKKGIITCIMCVMYSYTNAQLYVDSNGNTTIGDYFNTNTSLSVNSSANSLKSYYLTELNTNSHFCALGINNSTHVQLPTNVSHEFYGIQLGCENNANSATYGITTCVSSEGPFSTGRAYGLLAEAGRSTPGWNFGICTSVTGENNGAGLFASSGSYPEGFNVNGRWAGYFDGNVNVVGNLSASSYTCSSDYRLKENIRQIDNGSLDKILGMNVVKYKIKNTEVDMGDTAKTVHYKYPEDSPLLKKDHYGVIAQELREIYPELVNEGEDGYLSVNYIELVPILIKSIQELALKVEALKNESPRAVLRGNGTTSINQGINQTVLFQNDPNPFTEKTTIKCIIPNSVKSAVLYIYDMNGRQIDSMPIPERENVTITIEGSRLDAGMYMYSLVTDGNLVDTKRMILTK
ncbi:MAG: tail fiber domain-containing protein [Bacteroidaceae bacterium]|nr:tail fiber domain-containing protein [Bacteroidaceae bacterium]